MSNLVQQSHDIATELESEGFGFDFLTLLPLVTAAITTIGNCSNKTVPPEQAYAKLAEDWQVPKKRPKLVRKAAARIKWDAEEKLTNAQAKTMAVKILERAATIDHRAVAGVCSEVLEANGIVDDDVHFEIVPAASQVPAPAADVFLVSETPSVPALEAPTEA